MARDTHGGAEERHGISTTPERQVFGAAVGAARTRAGLTKSELAQRLGRQRSWLSKLESGYATARLPDDPLLEDVCRQLQASDLEAELKALRDDALPNEPRRSRRGPSVRASVVEGEEEVMSAIVSLIRAQGPEAMLRNLGIKTEATYRSPSETWLRYRYALQDFLATNPDAQVRRLEYVTDPPQLASARDADEHLRPTARRHTASVRFRKTNPLALHVLLGEREALIAFPTPRTDEQRSRLALVIDDQRVVRRLIEWYDDVLWEVDADPDAPPSCVDIRFNDFDGSFDKVARMYGFESVPASDASASGRDDDES